VRDLDVLIARDWPAAEARRLRALRAAARRALRDALAEPRIEGLLTALTLLPPLDSDEARSRLAPLARAARALPPAEDDLVELHRLRRSVRRLRHALEWLDEPADLSPVLDAFGGLNDLAQAVRFLGPQSVSTDLLAQRVQNALTIWRSVRPLFSTWC
jgi:hypothetical protein